MSFICRPALMSDQETIAHLSEQWGYSISPEKFRPILMEILQLPDHRIILLQHEGKTAGWIHGIYSYRVASDPFVEIAGLVVDIQYRRKGMGKFLVEEMVKWAKTKNVSLVRVRCQIIRTDANNFYSAMGFREIKQQKVHDLFL